MLDALFLLSYGFVNGFLVTRFWIWNKKDGLLFLLVSSVLISISLNSLLLYGVIRAFQLPFSRTTVLQVTLGIGLVLMILAGIKTFRARKR